jgi:DNA polymerase elongation subunit (family B)
METIHIKTKQEYTDLINYLNEEFSKDEYKKIEKENNTEIVAEYEKFIIPNSLFKSKHSNHLIFGKNETEKIIAVEIINNQVVMFLNDGSTKSIPNTYWFLSARRYGECERLEGNLHYKYIHKFTDKEKFYKTRSLLKFKKKLDIYTIWDDVEAAMVYNGITLFKGLKVDDVSRLHFDIETAGLTHDNESQVFTISNTFVIKEKIIKKTFRVDKYENDINMIESWCNWVQEINPSIINGHNIIGFDLPYLQWCYGLRSGHEKGLPLGKDCSEMKISCGKPRKFRVDGSNEWDYQDIKIFGRQIIDGMFLCVKYDFKKSYPSWGLKPIIEYEYKKVLKKKKRDYTELDKILLEIQKDRQFYDASKIKENWKNLNEREKIVKYCSNDGDDSKYLYDLQISSYFYYCQYIPSSFQTIINTATGRQINSFLVRAYLQDNYSIPKTSENRKYGGGISFGVPGVYKNVFKIDISALYPSIMLQYEVYDREKDPKGYFYKMVKHFAEIRLKHKKLAKETGERYYSDLEQSEKIVANSSYGLLGTSGLNFNSFDNADFVTKTGRNIIKYTIKWATGKTIEYWNPKYNREND